MKFRVLAVSAALFALFVVDASPAFAHWCNNIWAAPARMVVKPEKATVNVTGGSSVKLKVYLRNNFPHPLKTVQMQASASGYTVTVAPASIPAAVPLASTLMETAI